MPDQKRSGQQSNGLTAKRAALGLGYFSLALGLLEVAAPGRLARWLGLEGSKAARNTLAAFGARELAAGGALLMAPAASTNVWNRVLGDAMDAGALAFVGTAMAADWLTARALDRTTGKFLPVRA